MTDVKQLRDLIAAQSVELRHKISQRDRLNIEIMQIEKDIHNLHVIFFKDAMASAGRKLGSVGLTEAIRTVLRRNGKPMTAPQMKDALNLLGFDLGRFKNPSAVIHNTLMRMAKAGELYYHLEDKWYGLPGSPGVPLLNEYEAALERERSGR